MAKSKRLIINELIENYEKKIQEEMTQLGNINLSGPEKKEIKIQIKHWGKIFGKYEKILLKII
jgi:hypothetical protein